MAPIEAMADEQDIIYMWQDGIDYSLWMVRLYRTKKRKEKSCIEFGACGIGCRGSCQIEGLMLPGDRDKRTAEIR